MIGPKYLSLPKSFKPIKNKINFRRHQLILKASHHVVSYKDDNRYQASLTTRHLQYIGQCSAFSLWPDCALL